MLRSGHNILTTHVGSLPRPPELLGRLLSPTLRVSDQVAFETELRDAVCDVVRRQVEIGIDIVDDGEYSKTGFRTYSSERLGGYETAYVPAFSTWGGSREALEFPEFYRGQVESEPGKTSEVMVCTGPVTYQGHAVLERDLSNLRAAVTAANAREVFVPSISPIDVAGAQRNQYYNTEEEFAVAVADAMRTEYKAIVGAGFVLQLDTPRLTNYYIKSPQVSVQQFRAWAEKQVEIINYALRDIPESMVRYHTCYGINMGPRIHDPEMKDIMDIILKINAGAYSFEAANPRHEHEWHIWERFKLPEGKIIIPGVITHSSVLVEHPELVAERIIRFAHVVGREHVIAGADCGFGSQASETPEIHPSIVWAKFHSLVEGARIASKKLWAS